MTPGSSPEAKKRVMLRPQPDIDFSKHSEDDDW